MGNKEWPVDWRVGNGSARVGLGCVLIPLIIAAVALLIR